MCGACGALAKRQHPSRSSRQWLVCVSRSPGERKRFRIGVSGGGGEGGLDGGGEVDWGDTDSKWSGESKGGDEIGDVFVMPVLARLVGTEQKSSRNTSKLWQGKS
jgi:hypothetical protein